MRLHQELSKKFISKEWHYAKGVRLLFSIYSSVSFMFIYLISVAVRPQWDCIVWLLHCKIALSPVCLVNTTMLYRWCVLKKVRCTFFQGSVVQGNQPPHTTQRPTKRNELSLFDISIKLVLKKRTVQCTTIGAPTLQLSSPVASHTSRYIVTQWLMWIDPFV